MANEARVAIANTERVIIALSRNGTIFLLSGNDSMLGEEIGTIMA